MTTADRYRAYNIAAPALVLTGAYTAHTYAGASWSALLLALAALMVVAGLGLWYVVAVDSPRRDRRHAAELAAWSAASRADLADPAHWDRLARLRAGLDPDPATPDAPTGPTVTRLTAAADTDARAAA